MKKIAFFLLIAFAALNGFAQQNPCPTVSGVRKTDVVNNGNGTCSGKITLRITNDVSTNPKGVRVEVFCGSLTAPPVINQCFIAPTTPGGADFSTNSFICPCNASITIRITRYTASNGDCQGGTCGNLIIIQESPLPVSFTSFTASRNRSSVSIKWETAFEQNNSGFEVQRNIGNNDWQTIATVASQSQSGNSQVPLSYAYTDINSTKGITQYRVRQIDLDGKSKYTDIRAVRGEGQTGKVIIYPNPSYDGTVNVVFEDGSLARDISVMDLSGRIIKEIKAVTTNNVKVDNLKPGMYSVRITVPETGEQTVQKIVVNKR